MTKSLWSIQFASNSHDFGSGVVVLDGSQAVGGDFGYYYLGSCAFSGNSINATVTITKHNPQVTSIFGDFSSFKLALTGTVNGDQILLSGHVVEYPQMIMNATARKLVDLA